MFYSAIKAAIESRTCISCGYKGHTADICPHTIGMDDKGEPKVLAYQYGGGSARDVPPQGGWRCLSVRGVSGVVENDDRWPASLNSAQPDGCVTRVEASIPKERPPKKSRS
jgi:hypothetical protein